MGFKDQFIPKILDGSKLHSFRKLRKDGRKWKVGDSIQFYEKVRAKGMRKFCEDGKVTATQDARMVLEQSGTNENAFAFKLYLNGIMAFFIVVDIIARADGFDNHYRFIDFFFPKKKVGAEWVGQLVWWGGEGKYFDEELK